MWWGIKKCYLQLDRLPTAKVLKEEGVYTVQAEVFGKGIDMWFRSQGGKFEILSQEKLRDEMKKTLQKMLEKYQ